MAFQCGFFNSIGNDRKYTAEQMNNPFKEIVSNGVLAKTDDSTSFQVQSIKDLNIVVKQGSGIFAGKWAILDADLPMTIPTPHVSMTRIDSVVVRINTHDDVRAGSIEYVQGLPTSSPIAPALTKNPVVTEYRLANIVVNPNVVEITQSNIEDTRPTAECGFVTNLLQNSDISATYAQWQAQFEEWLASRQSEYDTWSNNKKSEYETVITEYKQWLTEQKTKQEEWFELVKHSLADITPAQQFTNYVVIGENDDKQTIPIDMSTFNMTSDILKVYINGMFLAPTHEYTINGFESITLVNPVDAGTKILFEVIKTNGANIDPDYIEALWEKIQEEIE